MTIRGQVVRVTAALSKIMLEIPGRQEGRPLIVLFCGLVASGKTTAAKALVASEPNRWKRVNRDDLRFMLHGIAHDYTSKEHEKAVTVASDLLIKTYLAAGNDVVVDNTFLNPQDRKAIHKIAADLETSCDVVEKVFCVPVAECLRRNALREGQARVPDAVIVRMAAKARVAENGSIPGMCDKITSYDKAAVEPVDNDEGLPGCLLVDLDGTLCLFNGRGPYDAAKCESDLPNRAVLDVITAFHTTYPRQGDPKIIFMSGRSSKFRPETLRWLARYVPQYIPWELHMRAEGDARKDSIVKRELFQAHVQGKFYTKFVLDDRRSVVDGWRKMGLVCFQVAPGEF